jgi:hypothetical protein
MIGLELIPSHYQAILDSFQNGNLSTGAFLEAIHYSEDWGFPWSNYAPIFNWAKKNKIPIVALDRPKEVIRTGDSGDLHERDRWAAGRILQTFQEKNPSANQKGNQDAKSKPLKMFVLFGELHIGSKHLPSQLSRLSQKLRIRPLKWLSIHQNEDRLYWKLAVENLELCTQILQLKKNIYCVFSSTPWAKLQSLVNWAEGGEPTVPLSESTYRPSRVDQQSQEDEDAVDFLSLIRIYGDTLSEFLGSAAPSGSLRYEELNVVTIHQAESIQNLGKRDGLTQNEIRTLRFHLAHHFRFLLPKLKLGYLATPSHNGAAEIAAIYLLSSGHSISHSLSLESTEDFYRLILESAFGFFGSLILNPRRKCDLPIDHMQRIKNLKAGSIPYLPLELEARMLALEILRSTPRNFQRLHSNLEELITKKNLDPQLILAYRFAGRIFGKLLHLEILAGSLKLDTVHEIFLEPIFPPRTTETISTHSATPYAYQKRFEFLLEKLSPIDLGPSKQDQL